ncbi:MAG: sensor signal transduction histidine kinase [Candidatus Saccharibacteria bacterium]|jgi:PAS domain S-box-containing protein|nr:sensor signal transduction histidine kinase [Candidatus Saccharibacteria bacterium]
MNNFEKVLLKAVEASSESIIITDPARPDNPIIYANAAFTRLTGYTMDEIVGSNCRFLQGEESERDVVARMRGSVLIGTESRHVITNYRKDGTKFKNELLISPVHDKQGRLRYFMGVQHEVA